MATENNPNEDPAKKKNKTSRIILIVLVALLLVVNGIILFLMSRQGKELETAETELYESEDLRTQLEEELAELELELEEYKGENLMQDSLLVQRQQEIQAKTEEIQRLLKEHRLTREQYRKAQQDIERLRYYIDKYVGQIDSLSNVNQMLSEENVTLQKEVRQQKIEKSRIVDENVLLENKLALGSMLQAEELLITGIKLRNSGKEKETDRSKHIEQVKICFALGENLVAEEGYRDLFVKILNPEGSTIHAEELGSGQFSVDGEESLYSMKQEIYYNNKPQDYCVYFDKGSEWEEGAYLVELYTDGYLLGKEVLVVK